MPPIFNKKLSDFSSDLWNQLPKANKIYALKRCPLFKSLSNWELLSISRLARLVEFKKDELVFKEGEKSNNFFIVVSGRFEAYTHEDKQKKTLSYLKQSDFFGELSLLTEESHSATVKALSDSLVLSIPKADFRKMVESNAKISMEFTRHVTNRLRGQGEKGGAPRPHLFKSDIVAVYSARRQSGQTAFSMNLAAGLHAETSQPVVLIDMSPTGDVILKRLSMKYTPDPNKFEYLEKGIEDIVKNALSSHQSGIEVLSLGSAVLAERGAEFAVHLLNRMSVDFRYLVLDLPSEIDDVVIKIMKQADHLYFVTDNNILNVSDVQSLIRDLEKNIDLGNDKITVIITETLLGFRPATSVKRELFGGKDSYFLPSVSAQDGSKASPTGLVVIDQPNLDYSKTIRYLSRKISKNLIGVALGSGAALGFAQIGVLKVLERENIPIDFIAGSSMGAMIAAFYAVGYGPAEMEEIASKFTVFNMITRLDISLIPIRGILAGRKIGKYLARYIRNKTFEETRIPLYLIGFNIDTRKEVVMHSGPILKALRASIAIPGVFHPVEVNGETLIDGGVIDPLPIRPMTEAGIKKIIAVNVLPSSEDILAKKIHYQSVEKRIDALMKKRNIFVQAFYSLRKSFAKFLKPNLIDIVVSSIQTMEHTMAISFSEEADVVIEPRMPLAEWVDFHRSKEIIRQGEIAAEEKLGEIRALVKQQVV